MTDTCDCSRRLFLKGSGLTLAGFGLSSLFPQAFISQALASTGNPNRRLLFIFQRGGNDGLNTLIPHGDSQYNLTLRPSLYIAPGEAIPSGSLNGFARLHPAMQPILDVWNAGDLAILHRVGYAGQSRSHFDSQRIWENGNPSQPQLFEGWLYRYIRESALAQGVDLPVLTSQSTPPLVVSGGEKFVNVANPDSFDYLMTPDAKRVKFQSAWSRRFSELGGLASYRPLLSDAGVKLVDTLDEYRAWDQDNWHPTDPNPPGYYLFPVSTATNPPDPSGPNGLMFPTSAYAFFKSLKVCALSLLESVGSTNGTRVAGTQLNGWDHHTNQGKLTGVQADLLKQLAYGIRSLSIVLSGQAANEPRAYPSVWPDTVVVTMTEFGRTSGENGSSGTDHAEAGVVFAAGGGITGGVYNCDATSWVPQTAQPSPMFDVGGRYLSHVTDYRALFWEILRDHMGADPAIRDVVFPGYPPGLIEPGLV